MRLSGSAPFVNPAASFENKQQNYYIHELNRALPTRGSNQPDMNTIQLALGNTDPSMPQGARQISDARNFVADFGAKTNAVQRDAECRAIPYPGPAMRAADARAGCGWWFSPNPTVPSTGAYGSRRGPMSPNLDTQIGPGEWVWDTQQAYMLEGMKAAATVQSCPDLQFSRNPNIGWCPSTGRAVMTDGNGNPAFPQMASGDCPGGGIIMNAGSCPPPPPPSASGAVVPGGVSALCQSTNGVLGPACLQAVTGMICSPNGSLAQSLGNGYAGQTPSFNDTNKYLLDRGFTLHSGLVNDGRLAVQDALTSVAGLKTMASSGDGSRANEAAMNLCYGTPFNPCFFNPGDKGPFDANCITEAALGMGYNANGKLLPAAMGMQYWNTMGGTMTSPTWNDVVEDLIWWKTVADLGPLFQGQGVTAADQANAIMNVYGTSVKYPKQGCNNFGVLMYRYYFPTWDGTLFPPQGPQTHFLGRYILKNGFPAQASTLQDMTPAGGYLTEGQRMVADFYPTLGGNYQFVIACDDMVRMQLEGQVIGEVGCCNVPTPTQIVPLIADQPYEIIIDLWNGGGAWSFAIMMSIDGTPWQPIPLKQLSMTQDRRLPTIELAFNKMPAGSSGPIADTNGVLNNLQLVNTSIGQLGGKQCMLITGPRSGVFNNLNFIQGIRIYAMKSITLMVFINTVAYPSGTSPSIFGFYNLPDSNPTAYPRKSLGAQPYTYMQRTTDFMMTVNNAEIFPYGLNPNWNPNAGVKTPAVLGQWIHLALVWDEDFKGCVMYTNGKAGAPYKLTTPPYSTQTIVENICIGCDNHPDGQNWTGGIAWFRTFDYQLSKELVTRDMNDDWASLN